MGTPANGDTKKARRAAHAAFDRLWHDAKADQPLASGNARRRAAYRWMRKAMAMSKDEAHIGRFNAEQCARLIALVEQEHGGKL